ncbi:MAG TPA: hypothetical protein VHS06_04100 [Chloroflexota bacterium]|nr:hypothetical protein [Chloroflexota bacterium]
MVAIPRSRWQDKEDAWGYRRDAAAVAAILVGSVALVVFFLLQEMRLAGVLGMPLDDAWIHFRIAENLATGQGFSYNPGVPTSASTSPAWTALLALAYLVTGQFVMPALLMGVGCYLLSSIAVYYLALQVKSDRRIALVAALLCAATGRWIWAAMSGMETAMFTGLILWGLLLHCRGSAKGRMALLGAGLVAVSTLLRPEGYLFLGLLILDRALVALLARPFSLRDAVQRLVPVAVSGPVLLLAAAIVARLAYTLVTGGGVAGNTFLAQSLPQGDGPYTGPRLLPDVWYLRSAVDSLRTDDFLLGMLITVGLLSWFRTGLIERRVRRLTFLSLIWFVGLPLANSFMAPNLRHHERYLMPLIPFAALLGSFGVDFAANQVASALPRVRSWILGRWLTAVNLFLLLSIVCLGDALFEARRWSTQYAGDVRSIQAINVHLGEWLRDNTPSDAYIAMNDIGAIAFISDRRILDTVGIAEPGILPYISQRGREGVMQYVRERRPDYLVIWPEWYPEMASMRDVFEPIYSARVDRPLTATRESMLGGSEMVVYRAHWR